MTEDQAKYVDPRDRFACRCCGRNEIDPRLVGIVRTIEAYVGGPVVVNSGYRCEKHNREVGGSPTSSHLKGLAADLSAPDSRTRYHLVAAAIRGVSITRIGIYKTFVHIDIDRQKDQRVIWLKA